MSVVRAALVQTNWTGDKESMIVAHEEYARQQRPGSEGHVLPGVFLRALLLPGPGCEVLRVRRVHPRPTTERFQALAAELGMVLVLPCTRRSSPASSTTPPRSSMRRTYLGKYRKQHIPQVKGFWEKFYFKPAMADTRS